MAGSSIGGDEKSVDDDDAIINNDEIQYLLIFLGRERDPFQGRNKGMLHRVKGLSDAVCVSAHRFLVGAINRPTGFSLPPSLPAAAAATL